MKRLKSFSNSAVACVCAASLLWISAFQLADNAQAEENPPETRTVEEYSGELSSGQEIANVISFPFRIIGYIVYYPLKFIFYDIWAWLFGAIFSGDGTSDSDLIDKLDDPDASVKAGALRGLAGSKCEAAVDKIIGLLSDPDETVRSEAVAAIARIGAAGKSAKLMDLAENGSPWQTRAAAMQALGLVKEKAALSLLLKAAEDRKWEIRFHALNALGNLGDVAAGPKVAERLKDSDRRIRAAAAWTLGSLGDPAALPVLHGVIESFKDEGPAFRASVVYAIGLLGGKEDAEKIFALLKSPLLEGDPFTRGAAAHVLGEMGFEKAEADLTRMLLAEKDHAAVFGAAAGLALLGRLGPLAEAMKAEDPYRRIAGVMGALKSEDASTVPLIADLLSDPYSDVRHAAIEALLGLGAAEGVEGLIAQLAAPDMQIRAWSLEMLKKISGEDFGLDQGAWKEWWVKNRGGINLKALFGKEQQPRKKLSRADRERSRLMWAKASRAA